jgi:hypothetical protein
MAVRNATKIIVSKYCEWPHDPCHVPPTKQEKAGAAFCDEHYAAWANVMQGYMYRYLVDEAGVVKSP